MSDGPATVVVHTQYGIIDAEGNTHWDHYAIPNGEKTQFKLAPGPDIVRLVDQLDRYIKVLRLPSESVLSQYTLVSRQITTVTHDTERVHTLDDVQ